MGDYPKRAKKIDSLKLNKEIAYKGSIGRKRNDFCINYIKKKGEIISKLQADQIQTAAKNGEKITCQKGCSYCCLLFMQASIQECEAIVYYLYHNKTALNTFLGNYKDWREGLRKNGDIFKRCAQLWIDKNTPGAGVEAQQAFIEEAGRYQRQNIACPFLHNNLCVIYEVRPFTCAGTVAVTPPDWCNPSNENNPKLYQTRTPAVIDKSFYYKEIKGVVLAFMPLVVYGILEDGYRMLSIMTGLEDLEEVALKEPEVRQIIERLS
jgi:Fe-S-cluster containining protein